MVKRPEIALASFVPATAGMRHLARGWGAVIGWWLVGGGMTVMAGAGALLAVGAYHEALGTVSGLR
jgi:hypothetical protein